MHGSWFEKGETGIAWQGEHAWRWNDIKSVTGLKYDVVYGKGKDFLSKRGLIDITMHTGGVNQKKAKKFDFSYPTAFFGVYIFSSKGDNDIKGNVFKGVFDNASYCMASIAIATMVLLTFLILKKYDSNPSIEFTMLRIFGNVLTQSLPDSMIPRSFIGAAWILLVSTYNMLMFFMYRSIIISLLTVEIKTNVINNLGDLNKTENENVRILLTTSYVPQYLKEANMLTGFENRIDYVNRTGDEEFVINSILNGSHVLIETFWDLGRVICKANKKADKEMATIQDFWKSIEPLFSSRRANLVRKKYKYAENVDIGLMWFHSFGFWDIRERTILYARDLRKNDGLWAPDEGRCKNHDTAHTKQSCTLIPRMDYNMRTKNIGTRVYKCLKMILLKTIRMSSISGENYCSQPRTCENGLHNLCIWYVPDSFCFHHGNSCWSQKIRVEGKTCSKNPGLVIVRGQISRTTICEILCCVGTWHKIYIYYLHSLLILGFACIWN